MDNSYKYFSARNFIERLKDYSVDSILSKGSILDDFIHSLSGLRICNADGSSHCDHRLGFYKDGVLLISHHHTDNYCYIYIASNPNAKLILGDQNSRVSGNPDPRMSEGQFVGVWSNSYPQLKDGPWVNKVKEVIQYAIDSAITKANMIIEEERFEIASQKLEQEKFNNELVNNWAK